jgi:hypothetical protein
MTWNTNMSEAPRGATETKEITGGSLTMTRQGLHPSGTNK